MTTNQSIELEKRQLWWAAIKPPMYTVAVIPILLGTAIATVNQPTINYGLATMFLVSAISIIAWLNLSNDVFDADTGIDRNKHHSIVNLTGQKDLIFYISTAFLLVGLAGIGAVAWWSQDWRVLALILGACFLGYTYQGPPFRLGYHGLGELICLITFGPMTIAAVVYAQGSSFNWLAAYGATFIGLTTTIILFCSHFHQVTDDLAAGKRSPIVRLGTQRGAQVLTGAMVIGLGIVPLAVLSGAWPPATLLVFLSSPIAWQLVRHVQQFHDQPERIKNCKFIAVKFHFWSGLLLCFGLVSLQILARFIA
ncbi:MAG: 2-carboxy-1,4-naphthoquinone phytyltransferase [Spirulina sp. SIO3F2]|nr:2-carboxy-1,4-naphthoquinone phytyltransferase [Spirulina sp. SIO3F2]